ncbi:MAG: transferrin-binding protein-like solute binding protein [Defluviicoccus sp.]|nr:transferrin-binding protein-like solute binding protein [Defluviicoccus sp.]MDE0275793.1 transferrin-binding protein-like solute binding protein [Defluviicoccus sp.]
MRRGVRIACAASAIAIALAACTHSDESPPPTADELARASYEGIVSGANAVLMGDHLGYFGTDDDVERVGVRCLVEVCSTAFARSTRPGNFSVETLELELLGERRGVSLVVERVSGKYADIHVYGGWLDHSFFASQTNLLTNDIYPDRGATVAIGYAVGFSTGENPNAADGTARWEGVMIGRDMSASASRGQVLLGDADVTVDLGASAMTADVEFTGIANTESGARLDDMAWRGIAVEEGGFARRDADDDTISGRFFGPNEEEVGGVFERDGIAGVFGGRRASD